MKINISILLFCICVKCFALDKSVFSKYFVKEKTVLLRWVPANKQLFDLAVKNGYRITRYTKENNTLSSATIIAEKILPYSYSDSVKWLGLIRKNENAILILKALYENKNSHKLSEKEKEEQNKMVYNLMLLSCDFDAEIAKACGLYFKDSTISNTKTYAYKIEINNEPASSKIFPVTMEVNTAVLSVNPSINGFSGIFKNRIAKLKWKASDFTDSYGGYNIERSADNSNFKRINTSPIILLTSEYEKKKDFITYSDTVPDTKVIYYYRIRGINNFGEESDPSNVISGKGYDEMHSSPVIDSLKVIENRKVYLRWKMKDEKENKLPKEYILVRSEKDNGVYSILNISNQPSSFTDESPKPSNYYKIGAVTYGSDTIFSYSSLALIVDSIAPTAPTGLKAKVDSKGNVELTWNKNPENDVKGYKIFKANTLTEEFVQINNEFTKTTSYNDKLNLKTLSKKIYYSIVATDNNFNSSDLSKPVEVKRPDTISPVPAVLKNIEMRKNGIWLSWIPSSSDDVNRYILYHQNEKLGTDVKIREWNTQDTTSSFLDTTLESGTGYRYKIVTLDGDDNMAISNIPYMFFETGFRIKITDVKSTVDRRKRTITLNWNYIENGIDKFIIYRSKPNEPLTIIKTLAYPASSFEDNTLNIGNTYEYRIKAVFNNGAESIISDAVIAGY
jgi:hypothetical protein